MDLDNYYAEEYENKIDCSMILNSTGTTLKHEEHLNIQTVDKLSTQ